MDNNTVSVNISRLRTKIEEDASRPARIKTVHGIGIYLEGIKIMWSFDYFIDSFVFRCLVEYQGKEENLPPHR